MLAAVGSDRLHGRSPDLTSRLQRPVRPNEVVMASQQLEVIFHSPASGHRNCSSLDQNHPGTRASLALSGVALRRFVLSSQERGLPHETYCFGDGKDCPVHSSEVPPGSTISTEQRGGKMNNHIQQSLWLTVGLGIGAGATWLFTTRDGRRARRQIAHMVKDGRERLNETGHDAL